jgi:serine/threonine protein kinase
MAAPHDCLGSESVQTLLATARSPDDQERCLRHLESCPSCRTQVAEIEAFGTEFLRLARQFGDTTNTPDDPILAEMLRQLHEVHSPKTFGPVDPADLYFLHPTDRPDLLGTLGDYEVQEVIGQGGMGVVLKAFEPALHRLVAIKVLAAAVAGSATARRRFTREAQAAAAVCHEHIVAVHRVDEADGLPYLVMQYVAGESLQARLDRTGPLEVTEIVRIGMQTAAGLAAAHAQGLIHRDIKPANLLLENGVARVKITDFGLARMVDDVGLTQNGVVAGTPEYMAPEQARGEPVDHRADLFSLGSVLYAMCTGRPPFRGSSAVAVLRQVSDEEPPPVRSLNADVPAWLEALIVRLIAKDPNRRFQSAAEVAELLEGYLAHLRQPITVAAPEPSPLPPLPDGAGEAAPLTLLDSWRPFLSWAGVQLGWLLPAVLGLVALGLVGAGQKGDRERPAAIPQDTDVDVWSVAVSADGTVVAAGAGMWGKPGEIGVWNLATREPLQRFAEDLGVASVALSPDGKRLASGSWSGHVRVYNWASGKELFDIPVGDVARVAFSPDGTLLATVTEDRTAQLWDMAQGKLLADLEGDLFRFHCVTFSPDGKRLLAGGGDWKPDGINQVAIWDVADRKQVLKLTGHKNAILAISFSPDGKTIATGAADNTIRLWDAASGQPRQTLTGHTHWVESVVFTPDGKTLVSGGPDRTIRFWDLSRGRENEKQRLRMPGTVRCVRFTPDGEALVAGSGPKTLKVYTASADKELATLWNGAEAQPLAMDLFPIASPTKPVGEKRWLSALGFLGLGLAFLVSLSFAIGLSVRHRRAGRLLSGAAAPPASLIFPCAACGKRLKVKAERAGKKVKCPQCGQPTAVPPNKVAESPRPAPRRWWTRVDVLSAFALSGGLAALLVVGLLLTRRDPAAPPPPSRLQMLADRVKAKKTDIIDARPYPWVNDHDLSVLAGLDHLRVLNLDNTEITDEGLKDVAAAGKLVSLSLTSTQVTDAGLVQLKSLTALEDLRLDKLPISDAGLAHLTAFSRLKKLSLYQTKVGDDGLAHLKQLPALEELSLDDTAIGDAGLRHLSQSANLKKLKVWQTRVTPAGIEELRKALPRLQVQR